MTLLPLTCASLVGIELNFFTVIGMGLCFGFALNTGLLIQRCSFLIAEQGIHRPKAFPTFLQCHAGEETVGETQPEQLSPAGQGDICHSVP